MNINRAHATFGHQGSWDKKQNYKIHWTGDGVPRLSLLEDGEERLHFLALDDVLVEGARNVLGEVVQDDDRILGFYSIWVNIVMFLTWVKENLDFIGAHSRK